MTDRSRVLTGLTFTGKLAGTVHRWDYSKIPPGPWRMMLILGHGIERRGNSWTTWEAE